MKVSYIHGICVKNDAISNSIRDEITWLSRENRDDVRLYAYACDYAELPFTKVSNLSDVIFNSHFQSSDLVVFHFGIFYQLFNLLPVVPVRAKSLVVFHNITPKQLVSFENYPLVEKSFQQMANILFADHVVCDSQVNLDTLRAYKIRTPSTVIPLAVHGDLKIPKSKPSFVDRLVRIVFVGRFVQSKGPVDLLEALHKVLQLNPSIRLVLDMIGNLSFSNSVLLEKIHKIIEIIHQDFIGRIKITIHGNASEGLKYQILRDADLFVLPTYHEGFCVPIVEALSSGCKVIAYKNSNTPMISGGLATLTPTGNVALLSDAIIESIMEIISSSWQGEGHRSYIEYTQKAWKHTQQYTPENVRTQFLSFIESFC